MEIELPFALKEKAFLELNETSENLTNGIAKLRKLIENEPNLKSRTDTQFLVKFLRARKFETNRAFQLLKQYYAVRINNPTLFSNLLPSKHLKLLEMGAQATLNERDENGSKFYVFRLEKCDMNAITAEDIFKTNLMALEVLSLEPETQISGIVALIDLKGFTIKQHLKLLSPYFAKWSISLVQESFPLRFCAFHVINQPIYFDAIFATIKPFMKKKLRKRTITTISSRLSCLPMINSHCSKGKAVASQVTFFSTYFPTFRTDTTNTDKIYFHGTNMASLCENVKKNLLPEEYGGDQILDSTAWKNRLLSEEILFKDMEDYGYKYS